MSQWIVIGLVEWGVGQWLVRSLEPGSWPGAAASLLIYVGIGTLIAVAFWSVKESMDLDRRERAKL